MGNASGTKPPSSCAAARCAVDDGVDRRAARGGTPLTDDKMILIDGSLVDWIVLSLRLGSGSAQRFESGVSQVQPLIIRLAPEVTKKDIEHMDAHIRRKLAQSSNVTEWDRSLSCPSLFIIHLTFDDLLFRLIVSY